MSRVCLNILQARRSRPEAALSEELTEPTVAHPGADPEAEALLGDSVGLALTVVLDTLTPAERVAFVLHDVFAVPFEEIAPIVDRSPEAARQLASRARHRVQGQGMAGGGWRQSELVDAFLTAARQGDFSALLAVLDPDVVLRADDTAVRLGASPEVRGAREVVTNFADVPEVPCRRSSTVRQGPHGRLGGSPVSSSTSPWKKTRSSGSSSSATMIASANSIW